MMYIRRRHNGSDGKKNFTLHCWGLQQQYCLHCDTFESHGPIPDRLQR